MSGFAALVVIMASMAGTLTRPPAVAGAFYPADPAVLRAEVRRMLGPQEPGPPPRALVVPHAGYVYSGSLAAAGFAPLRGAAVERVILLGPSHHQSFAGGALPSPEVGAFATPLGPVRLDQEALARLRGRPGFDGPASAHGPEHCLEVELPFLQLAAPQAAIVPILVGGGTDGNLIGRMARELAELLGPETVVVVSSDFTHHGARYRWQPFTGADVGDRLLLLGQLTAGRLAARDAAGFAHQIEISGDTVCGARPAMLLGELVTHAFEGTGEVVDVTTSGHLSGRWDLSVTYATVRFHGRWRPWTEDPPPPPLERLSAREGSAVVSLARAALNSHLHHDGSLAAWFADGGSSRPTRCLAGAFVTLHHRGFEAGAAGRLRACMGVVDAAQPLEDAVIQAAVWAAQDPRFPRLEPAELDGLELEVSVLSPRHRVGSADEIEVGTHGVVLEKNGRRALFLPQVAVEQGWDRETMLDHLAMKAGLRADGWRRGATFEVFTAQVFGEGP